MFCYIHTVCQFPYLPSSGPCMIGPAKFHPGSRGFQGGADRVIWDKEAFWKTRKDPNRPDSKGYWIFRICSCFENHNFLPFWPNSTPELGRIRSNLSKGTSTRRDLSSLYDLPFKSAGRYKLMFRCFGGILANFRCRIWPEVSIGITARQYLSFKPITKSLSPSVQKFWPVQENDDRRTDWRTP